MLSLKSITKSFHDGENELHVLRGIDMQIEPGERQPDQLADAQARAVHQLEHAAITHSEVTFQIRGLQQFFNIPFVHRLRQTAMNPGRTNQCAGVVLALPQSDQMPIKLFKG